ncbi:porin [Psychrobacter lutiphocae]|uniref:porin n=1 Tax=Psychrobacter lutiphocae TaxID=540500 RepID=UPI000380F8D6|nr:porin [Psychrobacter lutiphocae]
MNKMNKKVCASAVALAMATLVVSGAQAAPTIYGKAYMAVIHEDIDRKATNHGDMSRRVEGDKNSLQINSYGSRIGFKGSEPMTDNTDVIYQLEYRVNIDGDRDRTLSARDTFLGFRNKTVGEFRFGRNKSSTDRINNVVTADSGYWDNLGSPHNMVNGTRLDNSVLWTSPKLEKIPLRFYGMYVADEKDKGTDGWGVAAMFDQDKGFTAGLAYEDDLDLPNYRHFILAPGQNTSAESNDARRTRRNSLNTGEMFRGTMTVDLAKVMNNPGLPLTLGAMYQQADFDYASSKKEKGYVLTAQWALQNLSKPANIYLQYNNTSNLRGLDGKDSDQIVVGGRYFYKPNMIFHGYAGYNDSDIQFETRTEDGVAREYVIRDRKAGTETLALGAAFEYKF